MSDPSFQDSNIKVTIQYRIRPHVMVTRMLELTPDMRFFLNQADVTLFDEMKQQDIPIKEDCEFYSEFIDEMNTVWTIGRCRSVLQ